MGTERRECERLRARCVLVSTVELTPFCSSWHVNIGMPWCMAMSVRTMRESAVSPWSVVVGGRYICLYLPICCGIRCNRRLHSLRCTYESPAVTALSALAYIYSPMLILEALIFCIGVDLVLHSGDRKAAAANAQTIAHQLQQSNADWHLASGTYYVANPVEVTAFSGGFIFSPGASIVFTNGTERGMQFNGGANARFLDVRATFDPLPARRIGSHEAFAVYGALRPRWERFVLHGSPAAGLLHCDCTRPVVVDAVVSFTRADGVHFCNSEAPEARGVRTNFTGDDGLAFVNYERLEGLQGGTAVDIVVLNSMARGVSVVGQRSVQLSNVYVENSTHSGIYVAHEAYYHTRVPGRVRVSEAMLFNAGAWDCKAADPTNANCFQASAGRDPAVAVRQVDSATLTAVRVVGAGSHGFAVTDAAGAPPSAVTLQGCTAEKVPDACLYAYAPSPHATHAAADHAAADHTAATQLQSTALRQQRLDLFVSNFHAERCGGPAVTAIGLGRLAVSSIRTVDACTQPSALRRLVWTERNRAMMLRGLQAMFTSASATYCNRICAQCGSAGGSSCVVDDVAWVFDGGVDGNLTVQNDEATCRLRVMGGMLPTEHASERRLTQP